MLATSVSQSSEKTVVVLLALRAMTTPAVSSLITNSTTTALAVVGTPCQIQAIRKIQMFPLKKFSNPLQFVVGLMCTESFTYDGLMEEWRRNAGKEADTRQLRPKEDGLGKFDLAISMRTVDVERLDKAGKLPWIVQKWRRKIVLDKTIFYIPSNFFELAKHLLDHLDVKYASTF